VKAEQGSLADYVRRIIDEKDLSYRKVAAQSGGRISHATISDIINGNQRDIKTETLIGLAKGLGVSEDELFAVARGREINGDPTFEEERLLSMFRSLPPEWREELLAHAELTHKRHGQAVEAREPAPPPHRIRRKPLHAADKSPDKIMQGDNDEGNKRRAK
jgi:transcriptional regulator with XRE-family HTH domain